MGGNTGASILGKQGKTTNWNCGCDPIAKHCGVVRRALLWWGGTIPPSVFHSVWRDPVASEYMKNNKTGSI